MNINRHNCSFVISSTKAMLALGRALARACNTAAVHKCVVYLQGELGAGKTTLTRGFLRGLGYLNPVKSPTYTIVEPYIINNQTIYHFDLYRLTHAEELAYIGARDYFSEAAICLIEWPERCVAALPPADISCLLSSDATHVDQRVVTIISNSGVGDKILRHGEFLR